MDALQYIFMGLVPLQCLIMRVFMIIFYNGAEWDPAVCLFHAIASQTAQCKTACPAEKANVVD